MSDEYLKLTAYFAERLRSGDRFLADALLDLYGEQCGGHQRRAARHRQLRPAP